MTKYGKRYPVRRFVQLTLEEGRRLRSASESLQMRESGVIRKAVELGLDAAVEALRQEAEEVESLSCR